MTRMHDTANDGPFLLIDAGNTRVKWAVSDGGAPLLTIGALDPAGFEASRPATGAVAAWDALPPLRGVWLSNVAGEAVAARIRELVRARWTHAVVHTVVAQASECGVTNGYREPGQLGSDRWAALIGARAAYPGEHLLVVTLGTATTLEKMDAHGHFTGGLIAPGWSMMMESLGQRTAQLPMLNAGDAHEMLDMHAHKRVEFATDTRQAIIHGCLLAQTAMIERAWREFGDALGAPVRCIVGGGAADAVSAALPIPHTRRQHLVLAGLARIAAGCAARAGTAAAAGSAAPG